MPPSSALRGKNESYVLSAVQSLTWGKKKSLS
jgi:hypothetical protein